MGGPPPMMKKIPVLNILTQLLSRIHVHEPRTSKGSQTDTITVHSTLHVHTITIIYQRIKATINIFIKG